MTEVYGSAWYQEVRCVINPPHCIPFNQLHSLLHIFETKDSTYVEANCIRDAYADTCAYFLLSTGRIEAVMVSCPPLVAWDYNHTPKSGSSEEALMKILKNPLDWCIA